VEVDVAYFSSVLGATYAEAVLAALTKSTAEGLAITVTGLRQNGRTAYLLGITRFSRSREAHTGFEPVPPP
jgi:hypothetical protein